jgi:hypothetical protein
MGSLVDIEVCLLMETFGTYRTLVAFLATLPAAGFFLKILLRELD